MNFSISKKNFCFVFSKSNVFLSDNIKFYYLLNNKKEIGFIVSKNFGSAVKRNQFKRRCRKIFLNQNIIKSTIIIKPISQKNINYKDLINSFNYFSSIFL